MVYFKGWVPWPSGLHQRGYLFISRRSGSLARRGEEEPAKLVSWPETPVS